VSYGILNPMVNWTRGRFTYDILTLRGLCLCWPSQLPLFYRYVISLKIMTIIVLIYRRTHNIQIRMNIGEYGRCCKTTLMR
jgi:hypothetical protein